MSRTPFTSKSHSAVWRSSRGIVGRSCVRAAVLAPHWSTQWMCLQHEATCGWHTRPDPKWQRGQRKNSRFWCFCWCWRQPALLINRLLIGSAVGGQVACKQPEPQCFWSLLVFCSSFRDLMLLTSADMSSTGPYRGGQQATPPTIPLLSNQRSSSSNLPCVQKGGKHLYYHVLSYAHTQPFPSNLAVLVLVFTFEATSIFR